MNIPQLELAVMKSDLEGIAKVLLIRLIQHDRNFRICIAVYTCIKDGMTLGNAYEIVAGQVHLSSASIKEIYKNHRNLVENLPSAE